MQPAIAAVDHIHRITGAAHDVHFLDHAACEITGFVDILFQRKDPPAANAFISRDHKLAVAIGNPFGEHFRTEAAKDDGVDGPDPGAGEHRIGGLQDHWHIDRNAVTFLDAHVFQDIGEAADGRMELCVSDGRRISGIITFPDQRDLVAAGCEVTVNAIVRNIEFAIALPGTCRSDLSQDTSFTCV